MARPRTPSKQLSKDFNLREFHCSDGTPVPVDLYPNLEKLVAALQKIRDVVGKPITVNSGYRSPSYNSRIGGAKNSYHTKAMAADIRVEGFTPMRLASVIERLIATKDIPAGGLGVYSTFVHYDVRGRNTRWSN